MSEAEIYGNILSLNFNHPKDEEVHYVFGDQEFILDAAEQDPTTATGFKFEDIICADGGSPAILEVDGQYFVTDQNHPQIVQLQGEDNGLTATQYYIENSDHISSILVNGGDLPSGETEIVQLIDETSSNISSDSQQIIYYTSDEALLQQPHKFLITSAAEQCGDDAADDSTPCKKIKLNGHQMVNLEELLVENEDDSLSGVQFAVVEGDEEETATSFNNDEERTESSAAPQKHPESFPDLSKITGRNLITGQTVTLHSYMEKLKKKFNTDNIASLCVNENKPKTCSSPSSSLTDLLHKKIPIGQTTGGKKVVAKVINVRMSKVEQKTPSVPEKVAEQKQPQQATDLSAFVMEISPEIVEEISKTLGGVMEMATVRKKLENKNIIVKLVEKKFVQDELEKTVSYCYGFMEKLDFSSTADEDKWRFILDQENLEQEIGAESPEETPVNSKYAVTTSLTIVTTHTKSGHKTIRVNLNPAPGNLCTICGQYFKSTLQLRLHFDTAHSTAATPPNHCELCNDTFETGAQFQEHLSQHHTSGKLHVCTDCNKCFQSQGRLQKHLATHDVLQRPLECSVCQMRCSSQWALKKHLLTHTGIKPFVCDICCKQFMSQYDVSFHRKTHFPQKHFCCSVCMRSFSRQSNLIRHMEIHEGNRALYKCTICQCSYNFVSSLTRHMVQNHLHEHQKLKQPAEVAPPDVTDEQ